MSSAAMPIEPKLLEHVKGILRRDLKLGPDAAIADDMPFFGGDVDLDSLDMLLLVTSVEKEFGIKIPSEAVGREVFENVSTLAGYIQGHGGIGRTVTAAGGGMAASGVAANGSAGGGGAGGLQDLLARLPHGDPFRFVTELTTVREGELAEGVWTVTGGEAFFAGHFPGRPVVPGVLVAEALAQVAGFAGPRTGSNEGRLVRVDVRFERGVTPPAMIGLSARFVRVVEGLQEFEVMATVEGGVVARGSVTLYRA